FEPSTSADGRFVAYASNIVSGITFLNNDVFVHDRLTGVTERVSVASDGTQGNGESFGPSISADGRFVAFWSDASNLVDGDTNGTPGSGSLGRDVFVHDRLTGVTERVSVASDSTQGNGDSHNPSISADGRFVAYTSGSSNLDTGVTNGRNSIFVHDRLTGATDRVSVASNGTQVNDDASDRYILPSISADGRFVAFATHASNLVPDDTNFACF